MYDRTKTFDKVFLWSPTYHADTRYKLLETDKHFYKLKVFSRFNEPDFREVVDEMQADLEDYKVYERQSELWERFKRMRKPEHQLTDAEVQELEAMDWQPPKTDFKQGKPTFAVVFDDQVGNRDLYRSDAKGFFAEWAIRHRHARCCVAWICQVWQNGVPRQLRSNLSMLVLFAQKNRQLRESVAAEFASFVDEDTFQRYWELATSKPRSFLFCDFDGPPELRFRVGFDKIILSADSKAAHAEADQESAGGLQESHAGKHPRA
eukprot:jgi/Chrzof1/12341/Cz06g31050.t1